MAATDFKTDNSTFRKLIGNGLSYRIPRFQRDYSSMDEEWEDLWLDVLGTLQPGGEPAHYMGYLVLQSPDDKTFEVMDGQQRLTTVTIVILAILKHLQRLVDAGKEADPNAQRLTQIRQTYIGYLDPVTLFSRPKLVLNRNNNSYFQDYLVPLGHLPRRGFRASEHLLRMAFEWLDKRVGDLVKQEIADPGRRLAQLAEDLSDRLFFTVITVTDELNAYKVFETLNTRGVRLSATDLLKNYLFSVLDRDGQNDRELRALESRWESMAGHLIAGLGQALSAMAGINPNDAAFRSAVVEKTIRTTQSRNNRVAHYILCALERHLAPEHDHDFTSDALAEKVAPGARSNSIWRIAQLA
jgi:hypothetical protein